MNRDESILGAPELPWSREAEQSILGGALLDPNALQRLADRPLRTEHFFAAAHRDIWDAITELTARHLPVDVITVHDHLAERGKAEDCGGMQHLNQLAQSVVSAAHTRSYADIVIDRALKRRIIETADIARSIASAPGDAAEQLDRVASLFTAIQAPTLRGAPVSIGAALLERLPHWEGLEAGTTAPGMRTHLPALDSALCGGLKGGKVIVVAARPSVGKTSLAGQIGLNVAADGHAVLMLSQEMSTGDVVDRAVSSDPDAELIDGDASVTAARRRERARCAAIVTSPAGLLHPLMARRLALETRTTRTEAQALLTAQPAPAAIVDRNALSAARAARNPRIGAAGSIPTGGPQQIAASWDRAFKRAGTSLR